MSKNPAHPFTDIDQYPCPVCHCGKISPLPLMEALACDFCHHIFTVNLEKQILKMADRQPAMTWQWNGRHWRGTHLEGLELGWGYLVAAIGLIILPPTLLGSAAYYFPPTPGTKLSWLPMAWTGLALLSHLGIVLWLVAEIYQFPMGVYLRVIQRRLWGR